MSTHALSWAWRQEVGDAGAKLVLLKLADQANDRGECWPSHRTLATECEMSRRTVQRKLEVLYAAGLVRAEQRVRSTGGDSSLLYRVGVHAETDDLEGEQTSAAVRQIDAPPRVTGDAPPASAVTHHEPKEEPSSPTDVGEGRPAGQVIGEILEERFGRVAPSTNAAGRRRKAIADLRKLGATADSLRHATVRWPFVFPGATLTDIALATHFPQLTAAVPEREPSEPLPAVSRLRDAATGLRLTLKRAACPECEIGGGHHTADCSRETTRAAYRRFVTETAADPSFPLEEIVAVIGDWRDLDDVDRHELVELAEHERTALHHTGQEEAA